MKRKGGKRQSRKGASARAPSPPEEGWGGEGPLALPATRLADEAYPPPLYAAAGATREEEKEGGYAGYGRYGALEATEVGGGGATTFLGAPTGHSPGGGREGEGGDDPWALYDFHASAVKGYPLKVFFDILATSYACIDLRLLADGITLREAIKETKSIAHEAFVERCQLVGYHVVDGGMCVSFDVQALQKRLKNVRKKDTLTFQIRRSHPDKLYVIISQPAPAAGEGSGMAADSEEVFVRITRRDMALPMVDLPEDVDYHQPIVIGARRFQRVKRQIASQREVRIQMREARFLSISAHDGDASGATLNFGALPPGASPTYSRIFSKKQMIQIIKLPGMTSVNMAFREPKVRDYPLMASADIGRFGSLRVYIQDKTAIERAESQQWQQDVI